MIALAWVLVACSGATLSDLEPVARQIEAPPGWEQIAYEADEGSCLNPIESCPQIELTYITPADDDFGALTTELLENAGLEVWDPPAAECGTDAGPNCNVRASGGGVSALAQVTGQTDEERTVSIRLVQDSN